MNGVRSWVRSEFPSAPSQVSQHLINLFILPASNDMRARTLERQGFHLTGWERAGMGWWAVSDLNAQELAQFRSALEKASQ